MSIPAPSPYSVRFVVNRLALDVSQEDPGPRDGRSRAGFCEARIHPDLLPLFQTHPDGARTLFYYSWVTVLFTLTVRVQLSSNLAYGSCPYLVSLEHERRHEEDFVGIFQAGERAMVDEVTRIPLPTANAPQPLPTGSTADAFSRSLLAPVSDAIVRIRGQMGTDMRSSVARRDAPGAYSVEYSRCSASDWGGRGFFD